MLQRIGKFEILGQIGRGGQGTVYRARDTGLDRIVAITVTAAPVGLLSLVIWLSFSKGNLRRGRSFGRNEALMA
jgi:serine/threonine protein kinase